MLFTGYCILPLQLEIKMFQIKSCIRVLKEQEPGRVEGLLNALR